MARNKGSSRPYFHRLFLLNPDPGVHVRAQTKIKWFNKYLHSNLYFHL